MFSGILEKIIKAVIWIDKHKCHSVFAQSTAYNALRNKGPVSQTGLKLSQD